MGYYFECTNCLRRTPAEIWGEDLARSCDNCGEDLCAACVQHYDGDPVCSGCLEKLIDTLDNSYDQE